MRAVVITCLAMLAKPAGAACPDANAVAAYLADWQGRRPAKGLGVETGADAACARAQIVSGLVSSGQKVVGYKAALTAKAVQERFKATAPVHGVLTDRMILVDGARVPATFGARPLFEADLLLVVADEGVNDARTPEEALRHISGLRPFIELPDLALAPSETLEGPQLAGINAAARLGVAGAEVPLAATPDTVQALADMRVVMSDGTGARLAEGTGAATLGNPLNAVLFLAAELKATGGRLKAGDLVSVGSFSALMPPKAGQTVRVAYEGLPGADPTVSVTFE